MRDYSDEIEQPDPDYQFNRYMIDVFNERSRK